MEISTLTAHVREGNGKGASRQLRRQEQIPGVVYGLEQDALQITLPQKELVKLIAESGEYALVQIEVSDKPELSTPTMIREVQRDPIRDHVIHADFLRIDLTKKLITSVPVVLTGQAKGVVAGGVIDHQLRELEIECLAVDVPSEIKVNVADLDIGDSLHVSDMKVSNKIDIITDSDQAVASVHAPRAAIEEEAEAMEEGEEGVEVPLVGEEEAAEETE